MVGKAKGAAKVESSTTRGVMGEATNNEERIKRAEEQEDLKAWLARVS